MFHFNLPSADGLEDVRLKSINSGEVIPPVTVGLAKVLLVNVSVPINVESVPEVGKVTVVAPVVLSVKELAPEVVKLPPSVMDLLPLFTPVPP